MVRAGGRGRNLGAAVTCSIPLAGRRRGSSSVLDRHHDDAVGLQTGVHDDQPAPRSEQEAEARPAAGELGAEARKLGQRPKGPPDSLAGIGRKAQRANEAVEILDRRAPDLSTRHRLQVV